MRILGRFRRGQIRGVDFSLAMIIFLLTMSQVIVLTNTFIENAQDSQAVNVDINQAQSYAMTILSTPGSYSGTDTTWHLQTAAQLANNWILGLDNNNGTVSPYKIGRLSNSSAASYLLNYDTVANATKFSNDFVIQFKATIDVEITSAVINGPNLDVTARVTRDGAALLDADVNLFTFSSADTSITQLDLITNQTGYVTGSLAVNTGASIFVTSLATYGVGNQDVDYQLIPSGTTPTMVGQTLLPGDGPGQSVNVITDVGGTPEYRAFYLDTGQNTSSQFTGTNTIPVPENGLVVIMSNNGNTYSVSTFPSIIDGDLAAPLQSSNPFGTTTSVVEQLINIRGVVLRYSFLAWS